MNLRIYSIPMLAALMAVNLLASCAAAPSPTQPTTPTGISYVDNVIEAVQSGDSQALRALVVPSEVPCTKEKWLFRQPLCPVGEKEGTLIQTLPILSSDLSHVVISEKNTWRGIGGGQLYAVYRTGPYTYADEFFPAGEYAVVFVPEGLDPEGPDFATILQVTKDGIVRIDNCAVSFDICQGSTIAEIHQEHESAFILGPLPIGK